MTRRIVLLSLLIVTAFIYYGCKSTGNSPAGTESEKYRPLVHFTPEKSWMNDPNGMVYFEGEYHLFYQHYPDSNVWGPMHWGHAVSKDLVHWEHLPVALFPDSLGYIFSGSAVADTNNTSGLGSKDQPPLVAIYTYHDTTGVKAVRNDFQTQGIAYSVDKGRTWIKYKNNPVLKNPGQRDFRDPKVIWHKETGKWIMALASGDHIRFYSSPNLTEWTLESEFGQGIGAHGGVWECPDLFELTAEGTSEKKWVLLVSINPGGPNGGSATQYFTGSFDGHKFTPDFQDSKWLDHGKDNYAGVTFSNIPDADGRRILIGWMSNWQYAELVPTSPWRSAMTFPRTLKLFSADNGYYLHSTPVDEIQLLREEKSEVPGTTIKSNTSVDIPLPSKSFPVEVLTSFNLPATDAAAAIKIVLYNDAGEEVVIGYDGANSKFFIDRTKSGITDFSPDFPGVHYSSITGLDGALDMHIIVDAASVELFALNGRIAMTDIFFSKEKLDKMKIVSSDGNLILNNATVYKLNNTVISQ